MRLTNILREAFIRAAMDDVPKIDYDERANALAQADLVAQMPPKVQAVYKDKETRAFLTNQYTLMPGALDNTYLWGAGELEFSEAANAQLEVIANEKREQEIALNKLKSNLRAVAYSATTREALVRALPEFEKYAPPADEPASRSVPAIANLVSDFVKAGWPKGKTA